MHHVVGKLCFLRLFLSHIKGQLVAYPLVLFNQFWHSMHYDILHKLRPTFNMSNLILSDD
uniref:Uncharacterized protein n=1 Tax=Salix viminalis TaxID=40686 RepID=A0A6N2KN01_SALVM